MANSLETSHATDAVQPPVAAPTHAWGRPIWWVAAVVAGAGLIGVASALEPASPPAESKPAGLSVEPSAIGLAPDAAQWKFLKLSRVGPIGSHWTDSVPGRVGLDESASAKVGVPVQGRITRVMVELGDHVTAGQPLFTLVSPEVDELRSAKRQADVEADAARTALARIEATVAARALPEKEAQSARQRVRVAEVAQQLADDKLHSIRATPGTSELVVSAPRAGVVVDKAVVVSQQVAPDVPPLLTIADLSTVWVTADVFESQVVDIRAGGTAEVTTPSLPGDTMTGTVLMVSAVGDPERHTSPVRIRLTNADRRLRPNAYARIRFSVQHPDASVEIAATAIVSDGERQYVYVQESPGRFVRREVTAGSAHEGRMPIIKGLAPGETIVEDGAILLDNQIAISQ